MGRYRKYVHTPSDKIDPRTGEQLYQINYIDPQRGFFPEESFGEPAPLSTAKSRAKQLSQEWQDNNPPAPEPAKKSTWWK